MRDKFVSFLFLSLRWSFGAHDPMDRQLEHIAFLQIEHGPHVLSKRKKASSVLP